MAPDMRGVPAQWTTDRDLLPSPKTLRILAEASGPAHERYSKIAEASYAENGRNPEEEPEAKILHEISEHRSETESEQARLRAVFDRMDNLYYPESIQEPGGADHWPDGRKAGRAHISVNEYQVYVDIPASLQAVLPIENYVADDSSDEEREAAARIERLYFAWKDEDDFELKAHQACVVKGLYGFTYGKVYWDPIEKRPTLSIIDRPDQLYVGWGSSNYDRMDWALYCYGLSDDAIEEDFGLEVAEYGDGQGKYYPMVMGDHADPIYSMSKRSLERRNKPDAELVEVYDYWWKEPAGKGKRPKIMNAIFVGNKMVEGPVHHKEYDDIPYKILPNTYIPGSPYGRPELYDIEQLIREKDERLSAAAQMIDTITNGQMWQITGSEAPDEVPPNAMPKPNKVAAPGPNARLEALQPFVPQFAIEDFLKRIDVEIEVTTGMNEVLLGRAPQATLGSSKAMNALVGLYEARIRMKREIYYRWRKSIWMMAAKVWEAKDKSIRNLIDGRYRIDVKPPELMSRDELEVAQMAINLVNARLWSMERAMGRCWSAQSRPTRPSTRQPCRRRPRCCRPCPRCRRRARPSPVVAGPRRHRAPTPHGRRTPRPVARPASTPLRTRG